MNLHRPRSIELESTAKIQGQGRELGEIDREAVDGSRWLALAGLQPAAPSWPETYPRLVPGNPKPSFLPSRGFCSGGGTLDADAAWQLQQRPRRTGFRPPALAGLLRAAHTSR